MSKQDAKWIKKDDVTLEGDGAGSSGNLRVKDDGIDENKINSSSLLTNGGLNGGSGTKLSLDITDLTDGSAVADDDQLAIYDQDAGGHRRVTRAELLAGAATEQKIQEMITIAAGDITAGYFSLANDPVNKGCVSVTPVGGPQQVNYDSVGGTGATPDFDLDDFATTPKRVKINSDGTDGSPNLQPAANMDWTAGDVVIVEYEI